MAKKRNNQQQLVHALPATISTDGNAKPISIQRNDDAPAYMGRIIALLPFLIGILIYSFQSSSPSPPLSSSSSSSLSSSSASVAALNDIVNSCHEIVGAFDRYAHFYPTVGYREEQIELNQQLAIIRTELSRINQTVVTQLPHIASGSSSPSSLIPSLYRIPFIALTSHLRHRSGLIKLILADGLDDGRTTVTRASVETFQNSRREDNFIIQPFNVIMDYHHLFIWSTIPTFDGKDDNTIHLEDRSVLEVAVDMNLVAIVRMILPIAHKECDLTSESTFAHRSGALQLAEINQARDIIDLLRADGNKCILQATDSDDHAEKHAPPSTFDSNSRSRSSFSGGWRAPLGIAPILAARQLPIVTCDVTRMTLAELTPERFRYHHTHKRPMIITDALDPTMTGVDWRIRAQFTRSSITSDWGHLNVSAGEIPYGQLWKSKTGLTTFNEFINYMDQTYDRQMREKKSQSRTQQHPMHTALPYYIFDYHMFADMGWSHQPKQDGTNYSSRPHRLADLLPPSFYQLPSSITSVLNMSGSIPQFFLGSEGSGAPFHFHCPALNLLVYGQKRSQSKRNGWTDGEDRTYLLQRNYIFILILLGFSSFMNCSFPLGGGSILLQLVSTLSSLRC